MKRIPNESLAGAVLALSLCLCLSAWAQQQRLPSKGEPVNASDITASNVSGGVPSECDGVGGNLLANCGFETGDLTGWTQSGDPSFTDVSGPGPGPLDPNGIVVHSGNKGLRWGPVEPTAGGCIGQNVATTAGAMYTVSWWLEDLKVLPGDSSQRPNNFWVYWDSTLISGGLSNLPDFAYGQFIMPDNFASSSSTEVRICAYNDPDFFSLDDVVVVQQ